MTSKGKKRLRTKRPMISKMRSMTPRKPFETKNKRVPTPPLYH